MDSSMYRGSDAVKAFTRLCIEMADRDKRGGNKIAENAAQKGLGLFARLFESPAAKALMEGAEGHLDDRGAAIMNYMRDLESQYGNRKADEDPKFTPKSLFKYTSFGEGRSDPTVEDTTSEIGRAYPLRTRDL